MFEIVIEMFDYLKMIRYCTVMTLQFTVFITICVIILDLVSFNVTISIIFLLGKIKKGYFPIQNHPVILDLFSLCACICV